MNYNSDFRYDLKLGQLGEKHLSNILSNKLVEVKTDYKAHKTKNIYIEYQSRNRPSGISISESQFYAFVLSNETILLIETKKLKNLCRKYIGSDRDIKGGDNNTSKGIILPIKDII